MTRVVQHVCVPALRLQPKECDCRLGVPRTHCVCPSINTCKCTFVVVGGNRAVGHGVRWVQVCVEPPDEEGSDASGDGSGVLKKITAAFTNTINHLRPGAGDDAEKAQPAAGKGTVRDKAHTQPGGNGMGAPQKGGKAVQLSKLSRQDSPSGSSGSGSGSSGLQQQYAAGPGVFHGSQLQQQQQQQQYQQQQQQQQWGMNPNMNMGMGMMQQQQQQQGQGQHRLMRMQGPQ